MAQNRLVEGIVLLALFLVSTAGNSLALLVFYRRPGLRTVSNRFVINLLATNLVTTSLLAPALLGQYSALLGQYSAAAPGSAVWIEAGDTAAAACSLVALLAVTLVAVDQHHAVTDPLRCHTRLLQRRPAALCAATWLVAAAAAALRAALAAVCLAYPGHPAAAAVKVAYYVAYLVAVLAPVSVVCVMYSRIYRAARSSGLRARANGASAVQLTEPTINLPDLIEESEGLTLKIDIPEGGDGEHKFGTFLVPPEAPSRCPSVGSLRSSRKDGKSHESLSRSLPVVSSAPSLAAPLLCVQSRTPASSTNSSKITSIRYRISNASMFRYREESRAARVGLLTGALVMLYVPYALVTLLSAAAPELTAGARTPTIALLLLASSTCPFLFALRSRRVQREARRMFLPQKSGWERGSAAAADGQRARSALELLRALSPREGAGEAARSSFSSGGSTQVSSTSEE